MSYAFRAPEHKYPRQPETLSLDTAVQNTILGKRLLLLSEENKQLKDILSQKEKDLSLIKKVKNKTARDLSMLIEFINSIHALLFAYDIDSGEYYFVNQAFADNAGKSIKDIQGKTAYDFLHDPQKIEKQHQKNISIWEESFKAGAPVMELNQDQDFFLEDGTKFTKYFDLGKFAVKKGRKRILYVSSVESTDRVLLETALKSAKDKAEKAEKLMAEFTQNISHEIRTPLNGITGFTALLAKQYQSGTLLPEKADLFVKRILSSTDQLKIIVNDFLDVSKINSGNVHLDQTKMNISNTTLEILSTSQGMLEHENPKGKKIDFIMDPSISAFPEHLMGDKTKVYQMISNLVTNATKFTQQGSITVFGQHEYLSPNDIKITISVKDTGIGIPADALPIIFERFRQVDGSTTRKYGGTGLGLSIVKGFAQLMGGDAWAESDGKTGSTISFSFVCKISPVKTDDDE